MPIQLWKLPGPSSARARVDFSQPGGRLCLLTCIFDPDGDENYRMSIDGVEAYKSTFDDACTAEMVCAAYDEVVDLGATAWLAEVSAELSRHNAPVSGLRHLMIYFDDGPCYEFSAL